MYLSPPHFSSLASFPVLTAFLCSFLPRILPHLGTELSLSLFHGGLGMGLAPWLDTSRMPSSLLATLWSSTPSSMRPSLSFQGQVSIHMCHLMAFCTISFFVYNNYMYILNICSLHQENLRRNDGISCSTQGSQHLVHNMCSINTY